MPFYFLEDFPELKASCPPSNYAPQNRLAYRWVHQDINDSKNFTPRYYLAPRRDLEKIESLPLEERKQKMCDMLALSMFETEEKAKHRFNTLRKFIGRKIFQHLGTHIAQGCLKEKDGVCGPIDTVGHFEHHPISIDSYPSKFTILSKL